MLMCSHAQRRIICASLRGVRITHSGVHVTVERQSDYMSLLVTKAYASDQPHAGPAMLGLLAPRVDPGSMRVQSRWPIGELAVHAPVPSLLAFSGMEEALYNPYDSCLTDSRAHLLELCNVSTSPGHGTCLSLADFPAASLIFAGRHRSRPMQRPGRFHPAGATWGPRLTGPLGSAPSSAPLSTVHWPPKCTRQRAAPLQP